jgi:hypothetical protein
MTRDEWRRRLAEKRVAWAEEDRKFRQIVARREQRLRGLTFGLLGHEPHPS